MRHLSAFALWGLIALFPVVSGCNLFSSLHEPGSSSNVDNLISDALEALDEDEAGEALRIMDRAKSSYPNDDRVRYYHAVAVVAANDIDLLSIITLFEPAEDQIQNDERLLFLSSDELENLFVTFNVVREDLAPLVAKMTHTGRDLAKLPADDDVFLSHGVAETLIGMLRLLDNDDTPNEFSLDDRVVIEKTEDGYTVYIDDALLTREQRDEIVDEAIDANWNHFLDGRAALYQYYHFLNTGQVWTTGVSAPPSPLPGVAADNSAVAEMVDFVDQGVRELYLEKEDL